MRSRQFNIFNKLNNHISFFLFGARGVGKSYLVNHSLKNTDHLIIDLLKRETIQQILLDPRYFINLVETFCRDKKSSVIYIDEIQKVPALLDEVHYLIEKYQKKITFILTGSSARKLKKSGVNLLAGRAESFKIFPFSFIELQQNLNDLLLYGALPIAALDKDRTINYLNSYVDTYLKEEVLQEGLVRNAESFNKFLYIAAQYNGKPINYTKLARKCGVSAVSLKTYYEILEDTLIAKRLPGFDFSDVKQIMKAPKFYFFDNGVLNAIRNELDLKINLATSRFGYLFENMIVNEINKINEYTGSRYQMYYWQTATNKEVDLVLTKGFNHQHIAIEIKSSSLTADLELKSLKSFQKDYPNSKLYCFCNISETIEIDGVRVINWEKGIREVFGLG